MKLFNEIMEWLVFLTVPVFVTIALWNTEWSNVSKAVWSAVVFLITSVVIGAQREDDAINHEARRDSGDVP